MDRKKRIVIPAGIGIPPDTGQADSPARVPYASDDSVEAARDWANEHEL